MREMRREARRVKPLTRAESQRRTREEVLDAAEERFLDRGYHATTVAQIAAAAGRTQGAIYANFPGKEYLCFEVLQRRGIEIFGSAMAGIGGSAETVDEKLDIPVRSWELMSHNDNLTALVAEYLLAIRNDSAQREIMIGYFNTLEALIAGGWTMNMPLPPSTDRNDNAIL